MVKYDRVRNLCSIFYSLFSSQLLLRRKCWTQWLFCFLCCSLKTPPLSLSEEWLSHILLSTWSQFISFLTFSFTIYLFSSYAPNSISLVFWRMAQMISERIIPVLMLMTPFLLISSETWHHQLLHLTGHFCPLFLWVFFKLPVCEVQWVLGFCLKKEADVSN